MEPFDGEGGTFGNGPIRFREGLFPEDDLQFPLGILLFPVVWPCRRVLVLTPLGQPDVMSYYCPAFSGAFLRAWTNRRGGDQQQACCKQPLKRAKPDPPALVFRSL